MNKTYLKLSLDLDFILIAITASLKDYVLCHKINTALHLNLEKVDDHEVFFNIDEPALAFSQYYYDLNMTLLVKSGILFGSGALLLVARLIFNKQLTDHE